MAKIVGFSGHPERNAPVSNYHQSYYTQAIGTAAGTGQSGVGSYYQVQPEQMRYPNRPGSPQYSGYGSVTSREGYGQEQLVAMPPETPPPPPTEFPPQPRVALGAGMLGGVWYLASLAGAITGVYHGYKRNQSAGWAVAWGLLGGAVPIVSIPLSVAQGFGKRKAGR